MTTESRHNLRFLCILIGLIAYSSLVTSLQVSAVENGGVGGKPAYPRQDNPRSESIFLHELGAGESVQEGVKIFNNTDSVKTIEVYPVDALVSSGGAFSCEQKADALDADGTWINLPITTLEIQPNRQQTVDFSIAVPQGADVGEHNACIAIAAVGEESQSAGRGVQLSFRSAIRVAITVPGQIVKELSISGLTSDTKDAKITVKQTLNNSGNVSLDTTLSTSLKNIIGKELSSQSGEFVVLARNESEINYEFEKPSWGGWYKLSTEASYSDDVNSSLGDVSNSTKVIAKSSTVFVAPSAKFTAAYIVLSTFLISGVIFMISRKSKFNKLKVNSIQYTVQAGDTIEILAVNHNVNWKKIAKLNKLSPPYSLTEGDSLLLPSKQQSYTKNTIIESAIVEETKPKVSKVKKKTAKKKTSKAKSTKKPKIKGDK